MSGHGDLENLILSTVERVLAGRRSERHGLVTSWDPDKHLAKVMFQPEGHESGWLTVEREHIGNGFGMAVGLTPGDGKKTGDQVIVRFQEGDFESGKISKVVHSDQDKPPRVESGEAVIWTRFTKTAKDKSGLSDDTTLSGQETGEKSGQQGSGAQIFFKNDGSLTITDGAGSTMVMDGKGNHSLQANNHTVNTAQDHTTTIGGKRSLSTTGNDTVSIGGDVKKTVSGQRSDKVSKSWGAVAKSGVWSWLTSGGDTGDG